MRRSGQEQSREMALVADLLPALQPSAFVAHHARRGDLPEMHYLRGEGSAWVAEVSPTNEMMTERQAKKTILSLLDAIEGK